MNILIDLCFLIWELVGLPKERLLHTPPIKQYSLDTYVLGNNC